MGFESRNSKGPYGQNTKYVLFCQQIYGLDTIVGLYLTDACSQLLLLAVATRCIVDG